MINLGFDILLLIFDLLLQEDKLECMTVCQQWYDIIHTHSLFRDIYIDNQKQLDQLIDKVERNPVLGAKVEKFVVEFECHSDFDSNIPIILFPNLRYCALNNKISFASTGVQVEPHQNHPWCRHMKQIEGKDSTVKMLLDSGFCTNLKSISMLGQDEPARDFIESLANAPVLKKLDMINFRISLEDLELLHNTAPLLDSLLLSSISFYFTYCPLNIISATSVKRLRCLDSLSLNGFDEFFWYIKEKYTHVEHLKICRHDWHEEIYDTQQHTTAITSYMKILGPRLKNFSVIFNFCGWNRDGEFDLAIMNTNGLQLEKLELGDYVEPCTLERLSETTQAQYVRSLTISGVDYDQTIEPHPFSFSWLLRFQSLKELELSFFCLGYNTGVFTMNLTDMLESLYETRLERLRLYYVHFQRNDSSRTPVYTSLKNLTLEDATFDKDIDAFISSAFPNLKRLVLKFPRGLRKFFNVPNLDLSYLEMIHSTKDKTFPIMLITLYDGQRRLYNARTKEHVSRYHRSDPLKNLIPFPSAYCQSFDKSDINPMLTITCHSVYDFHLFIIKKRGGDIDL